MGVPTTYPVYDTYGEALLRTVGSFWYHYFADRDKLRLIYRGLGQRQGQAYLDYLTAVAAISRFNIPVFKEEEWYLLTIKQSDRDTVANVYGQDELTYGDGIRYGDANSTDVLVPMPDDTFFGQLADIPYTIYNRVLYPSKAWTRGIDFDIDYERKLLRFREDPFTDEYVATRTVYDENGTASDTEAGLWVYCGQFDLDLVYKHWAFAVTEQLTSSEAYKDFMNALWNGYAYGASFGALEDAIAAICGVQVVLEATERIEDIVYEPTRTLVITDKHVYVYASTATVIVAIGDTVHIGDELTNTVRVHDISGSNADYSDVPMLAFDKSFMSGGYFSSLTFENGDVTLDYLGLDEDNKAVVTFEVGGFPMDVDSFFEQMQVLGKQSGSQTLAELLDTRANPVGQPLPAHLPTTINPLEFVLDNIVKNHLVLVYVHAESIADAAPGLSMFKYLRNIIPPHTTVIVYVAIGSQVDTMDLTADGDTEEPGVCEVLTSFDGAIADTEDVVPADDAGVDEPSYNDVVVRVYQVSTVCK